MKDNIIDQEDAEETASTLAESVKDEFIEKVREDFEQNKDKSLEKRKNDTKQFYNESVWNQLSKIVKIKEESKGIA